MSDQDVAAVRRLFETQDLEEALEVLDPAVEVRDFDIPDADTYRGHDGYRRWLANWFETFPETSVELEEIFDSGDRVVVIIRVMARGRGSGRTPPHPAAPRCRRRACKGGPNGHERSIRERFCVDRR